MPVLMKGINDHEIERVHRLLKKHRRECTIPRTHAYWSHGGQLSIITLCLHPTTHRPIQET